MKESNLKKSKGFTLVELLVVIAILAVLATVSIVGYTSFTKKAKVSNDVSLTTQMNTILQANEVVDGKNTTPHEAVNELIDGGLDVTKLTPTANGYNYVYDLDTNRMILVDESMNVIAPEKSTISNRLKVFAFVGSENELTESKYAGYSFYLKNGFESDNDVIVSTSVDTGDNVISKLTYTNTSSTAQNVIVRTNGGNLVINAKLDSVDYYGTSSTILVEDIATSSFHVYGTIIETLEVKKGHVVFEDNSFVNNLATDSAVTLEVSSSSIIVDNSKVSDETEKAKTETAVKNSESKSYLNISTVDEFMIALGYTKLGESFYTDDSNTKYPFLRLKANSNIDLRNLKINNAKVDINKNVYISVNSSIDLNGSTITTDNFSFIIESDNCVISNGNFKAGENSAKATGINSYALAIVADNVILKELNVIGGISVGFETIAKDALIENCNVKAADYYCIITQSGSNATINGGEYSRVDIVDSTKSKVTSNIFNVSGSAGDVGKLKDKNEITFVNVKSLISNPILEKNMTNITITDNIINGYISYTIVK